MCSLIAVKYRLVMINRCITASLHLTKSPLSTNHITNSLNIRENTVIISQSHDIYENLAFEDWLYKNYNLASKNISILLMWYNGPSIVIGRHQNPWLECSVDFCEANGINIVRRNSGGGTVYHDFGNLNFSFLTSRKEYDRKKNLELICESIRRRWSIDLTVSERNDILYENHYKISGTASKLGRNIAYHHCTVLVDVDKNKLHGALHRDLKGVESKATFSIRAEVINLKSVCSGINTLGVMKAVTETYKQVYHVEDENVLCIDPNEELCPGLNTTKEELKNWDWLFGRTPRFTLTKSFSLAHQTTDKDAFKVEIILNVNKGVIETISLNPQILNSNCFVTLSQCLIGSRFSKTINIPLDHLEQGNDKLLYHFVKNCMLEMILDVFK